MTIWIALVGGIILGWVIEWIIDWLYWRRGVAGFYANEEDLRSQLTSVEQQRSEAEQKRTETVTEMGGLRSQLESTTLSLDSTTASLDSTTAAKTQAEQQLTKTVAEMGGLRSQLESATLSLDSATAAKTQAEQQLTKTVAEMGGLRTQLDSAAAAKVEVEQQKAEVERQKAETDLQKATIEQRIAELEVQNSTLEQQKADVEKQLQEAIDATKTAMQSRRDDLEQIDGIGRVYEQKLFDAGVDTFARLAITPVDRLREIIKPASWQQINFEYWIEQARKSAEVLIFDALPYRLEEIRGIGPVYAKRLNAEGIMTYHDLAHTSEKRLREIVSPKSGPPIDYAGWIKQARAFVAVTTIDHPPLPLERIKGIGPVFALRLDLAGIHTYADLANSSEEKLREIIGHRGMQIANLSRWIAEAKAELDGGQPSSSNGNSAGQGQEASVTSGGNDETVSA